MVTKLNKFANICFFTFILMFLINTAYGQNIELNVDSSFNKQFSKIKNKQLTVNDNIVTLKLNNYDKSEITFFLPEKSNLVSVFVDGLPLEHVKHGINFVNVPVNKNTKEISITTRHTMPAVYVANNITPTNISNRIGFFTLEIPLPALKLPSFTWNIYGEKSIFFIKGAFAEKIISSIDYIQNFYTNNSDKIKNYISNKYGIIALVILLLIIIWLFSGYLKRLYKMVAWFIVWPRKYIKPAGFVVLFIMFSGIIWYIYSLWCTSIPAMPNEIKNTSEACSVQRTSLLNKLSSNKDVTTNNMQTLIDKGVIKEEELHCPQFGFYNYNGNKVTCSVHNKDKNNLLFYQIKVPTDSSATSITIPEISEPKEAFVQSFFFADKAISYVIFAIIAIVFFFFIFIPVILAKPLDASYEKLFKKKAQKQNGFGNMNMNF